MRTVPFRMYENGTMVRGAPDYQVKCEMNHIWLPPYQRAVVCRPIWYDRNGYGWIQGSGPIMLRASKEVMIETFEGWLEEVKEEVRQGVDYATPLRNNVTHAEEEGSQPTQSPLHTSASSISGNDDATSFKAMGTTLLMVSTTSSPMAIATAGATEDPQIVRLRQDLTQYQELVVKLCLLTAGLSLVAFVKIATLVRAISRERRRDKRQRDLEADNKSELENILNSGGV